MLCNFHRDRRHDAEGNCRTPGQLLFHRALAKSKQVQCPCDAVSGREQQRYERHHTPHAAEDVRSHQFIAERISNQADKPPLVIIAAGDGSGSRPPYNPPVTADSTPLRMPPGQTLLFDADDTLWENNIYFERAISSFISYLDHRVHTPEEVREQLNQVERKTIQAHGYGLKSFRKSLIACFELLTDKPPTPEKHARIVSFAQSIADHEIELLAGVPATIAELAARHRCILVTKGDDAEQRDKLQRSGLASHFAAVEVLPEKTDAAYRATRPAACMRPRPHLDDRQQPEVGHQPRACRRVARRLHPARFHLGAGA